MKQLLEQIRAFPVDSLSYESLGEFVKQIDYANLDYKGLIPYECDPGDYGRNILCLEPFECVLIYWPPSTESAIHYHKGFYGYVAMLEGELDNVEYVYKNGVLGEDRAVRFLAGGVADEPDETIHKLANPSSENGAVSLHFYYPALDTLEDLAIYNTEIGAEGILSATAKAASWSDREGHFKALRENAFEYQDMATFHSKRSHVIYPVVPKPGSEKIGEMVGAYYCEQAKIYDRLDQSTQKRSAYTETINGIISDEFKSLDHLNKVLHIACGTGRRAVEIRKMSGAPYKIQGVDISASMCEVASEKDINLLNSGWVDLQLPEGTKYCAAAWLYAFGHISAAEVREQALVKLNKHLKMNAPFMLDVFNLENKNEWGPKALRSYHQMNLGKYGYQPGDVFYKRTGGKEIAFLHYFTKDEIVDLLEKCGFKIENIWNIGYAKDAGEIKDSHTEGFLMIHAKKARELS